MITQRTVHTDIAEYLLGTCKGVDDAAEQFNVDVDTVNAAVEEQDIFLCDHCDWWFERNQQSDTEYANSTGDELCEDCGDYVENED